MKIYIVGQDERSVKLRELYEKDKVKLEDADVVVCPIPFSKDTFIIEFDRLMGLKSFQF